MKAFFVLACLAALALSIPDVCYKAKLYDMPEETLSSDPYSFTANTATTWCFKYDMYPRNGDYAYVSLRRRTRFNGTSSLFFCASDKISSLNNGCYSGKSSYSYYASERLPEVYARVTYTPAGSDIGKWVYFEMKHFLGDSATDWSGYCPVGNCASRGACLPNGTCWCDEGHSDCDDIGLLAWIIAVIVIAIIVVIFVPIIIIICCCCCCACAAAGAAAAAH